MTNQPTEIAIVGGGGMVGGALALGLAQHGFTVTVIEHAVPAPFVADGQPDVRISAISSASVSLLKGLGSGIRFRVCAVILTVVWKRGNGKMPM